MHRRYVLIIVLGLWTLPVVLRAHSGGTDKYGCHNDRQRGGYHCHSGRFAGRSFASQAAMLAEFNKATEPTAPVEKTAPTPIPSPAASTSAQTQRGVAKTDAAIKQEVIKQSIGKYSGSCPCPYNADRAGRSCGARSAYSRPGGAAPLCYETDVTQKMVEDYRKRTK